MGLQLFLETEIAHSGVRKDNISNELDEQREYSEEKKREIYMLVASENPLSYLDNEDKEELLTCLRVKVDSILKEIDDASFNIWKLQTMRDNLEKVEESY